MNQILVERRPSLSSINLSFCNSYDIQMSILLNMSSVIIDTVFVGGCCKNKLVCDHKYLDFEIVR